MTADTRIAYGANCSWWGPIADVGTKPSGLPCCPVCGGMLFEVASSDEWWSGARRYEADGHPDYVAFLEWLQGRHFPSLDVAQDAYRESTLR